MDSAKRKPKKAMKIMQDYQTWLTTELPVPVSEVSTMLVKITLGTRLHVSDWKRQKIPSCDGGQCEKNARFQHRFECSFKNELLFAKLGN